MNQSNSVMPWVAQLPEVDQSILKEREDINALVREAAELDDQATKKRQQAYFAALALESRIRGKWADEEVQSAMKKTAA